MTKRARAPKIGTVYDLGRGRVYRVASSEIEQAGRIMVCLVRVGAKGPATMVAELSELTK
jgi:hypothetical protein